MKILGASLLFLFVSGLFSSVAAQSEKKSPPPLSDADRAIVQSWAETYQPQEARIEGDRLILPVDERNAVCAFLRVYRVKRYIPGSDATRPAGYTTCVGASRFTMKSSSKPQAGQTSAESARAK